MNKSIGIIVALAVVGGAILMSLGSGVTSNPQTGGLSMPNLNFAPFSLSLPNLNSLPMGNNVGKESFDVFKRYLAYAGENNIEGVRSLSHQTSPACSDTTRREECEVLMSNLHNLSQVFHEDDFKHIVYDDRQVVMFTDFMSLQDRGMGRELVRIVLFFTRTEEGESRVLGIKFCLEGATPEDCFQTDPEKRDLDGNGWWDQVEAQFNKEV